MFISLFTSLSRVKRKCSVEIFSNQNQPASAFLLVCFNDYINRVKWLKRDKSYGFTKC